MALQPIRDQEFDQPSRGEELGCNGRTCAQCHKCRDWHFNGDQDTWNWIINWNNWTSDEWATFRNDGAWKHFTKRDGATCDDSRYLDYPPSYLPPPSYSRIYSSPDILFPIDSFFDDRTGFLYLPPLPPLPPPSRSPTVGPSIRTAHNRVVDSSCLGYRVQGGLKSVAPSVPVSDSVSDVPVSDVPVSDSVSDSVSDVYSSFHVCVCGRD